MSPVRLSSIFRREPKDRPASDLYMAIVEQARQPQFYGAIGVPDTLDGRFELIVLHAFIVIGRLREIGDVGARPPSCCLIKCWRTWIATCAKSVWAISA